MQLEIYSLTALKDQISVSLEAICDSYSSLLWDIEFYQCGCFEVYIAASPQNVSIFQRGRIVARSDDAQHFGIIESLQLETDAEKGDYLTVTGRFLACLLERRIIYPTITANGSYEDIVRKVLSRNVISAGIRNLPGFSMGTVSGDCWQKTARMQVSYDNILEWLYSLCETIGGSANVRLDGNALKCDLFSGTDRSLFQDENPHIVFSDAYNNLLSFSYAADDAVQKNFAYVLGCGMKKRIALANAHDEPALSAVVNARRKGVVEGTLVGKKDEIIAMLHEMGESENDYEIVDFDGEELDAARLTVQLVREGKADIPMKGILQTSSFAKAILNRETGLIPASGRRLVSQCGIFEYEGRFMMITDAAINIAPDVDTQIGIVENALPVANALGIECPKVAVLSAVENVTEKMPSTVSAREIAECGVPGCIISGPLALDGAISMESVKHKSIHDPVAGQADILLVPYIEIGNVLYKACTYIAGKTMASTICGASCPVVITSRADTPDSKYYSILMAVLRCLKA